MNAALAAPAPTCGAKLPPTTDSPTAATFALPPVWSAWTWVLMMLRIGLPGAMRRISAISFSASGSTRVSTTSTPSSPICTVELNPPPVSSQTLPWTWNDFTSTFAMALPAAPPPPAPP